MTSRRVLVLLALCLASPSYADKTAVGTAPVKQSELPRGVTPRGQFRSGVTFADKKGINYVLFSSKSKEEAATVDMTSRSEWIFVDLWVVPPKGAPRNVLPVRDMVTDCVMGDVDTRFHDAAFSVTDLDHDGIAEITFGYELACRSDVSPATYKLLVIENGAKYILRGTTIVNPGGGPMGGTFTPDPAEAKWPAAFLAHAKDVWAKTSADRQIEEQAEQATP